METDGMPGKHGAKLPGGRRAKALATRRRMLRAAHELFCSHGYAGATMNAIADRAGVAVQTLYFTFNTKSAILRETFGAAIVGFDLWDPRMEGTAALDPGATTVRLHSWHPDFANATSAGEALRLFVIAAFDVLERAAPLVVAMDAATGFDEDVRTIAETADQRRVAGYRFIAEELAERFGLRAGVDVARATDILLVVLSAETYQQWARRGWSRQQRQEWSLDVLQGQLFG